MIWEAVRPRPAAIAALSLLAAASAFTPTSADAAGTLRIAMTASDIPLPNGQTDQGAEGMRFMGYQVFEGLIGYDLSSAAKAAALAPALATSWSVDPKDPNRWTFKLRPGVTFHDGSAFDADAVVWNFAKILDPNAPQYDEKQAAQGRGRVPTVASWKALDPSTVEIVTKSPDALLPWQVAWIVMSSPAQWEKVGKSWAKFLEAPSGTGPFRITAYVPRERAEMVPFTGYWDKKRISTLDKLVLLPVADPSARVAALRSGQVDWIEAPPPDALDSLKGAGFKITANVYPHVWPWHFSMLEGSPWTDIRVRKAANLAIDREGMKELLGGMMVSAKGMVPPSSPWFGKPTFDVKTDLPAAKKLMAEAGISKDKPITVKAIISPAGSGQMQPMLMNELIQQNLAEIGIKVEFDVRDWNALLANWRAGAKDASTAGATSTNSSYFSQDPFTALMRHVDSRLMAPKGTNWGYLVDPKIDAAIDEIRTSFDADKQLAAIQKLHQIYVDDALFLFVAHDVAPRAMSPKVQGFVQPQNWFIDLTTVSMKP